MTTDSTGSPSLILHPSQDTEPHAPVQHPDQSSHKTCRDCRSLKPLDEFGPHLRPRDKRSPYCRSCSTARVQRWRKDNPELYEASKRKYIDKRKQAKLTLNDPS